MPSHETGYDYAAKSKQRAAYEQKLIAKGVKPNSSKMFELMHRKFK